MFCSRSNFRVFSVRTPSRWTMGHPVAGDTKYGAQSNPIHRLALHAHQLKFIHPTTRQVMDFQTEIPKRFAGETAAKLKSELKQQKGKPDRR